MSTAASAALQDVDIVSTILECFAILTRGFCTAFVLPGSVCSVWRLALKMASEHTCSWSEHEWLVTGLSKLAIEGVQLKPTRTGGCYDWALRVLPRSVAKKRQPCPLVITYPQSSIVTAAFTTATATPCHRRHACKNMYTHAHNQEQHHHNHNDVCTLSPPPPWARRLPRADALDEITFVLGALPAVPDPDELPKGWSRRTECEMTLHHVDAAFSRRKFFRHRFSADLFE